MITTDPRRSGRWLKRCSRFAGICGIVLIALSLVGPAQSASSGTSSNLPDKYFVDGFGPESCFFEPVYDPDAHPPLSREQVVDDTDPRLTTVNIPVLTATPEATDWLYQHIASLDTRTPSLGLLVVYLMGAADRGPEATEAITTETLAGYGYHAIALAYPQSYGVAEGCEIGDSQCRGRKRLEAFEGLDYSSIIDIPRANSIEQRILDVLAQLEVDMPTGDWSYFLAADGTLDYRKVVISGQSHGASSAALIGKMREVSRVVAMSGPGDEVDGERAGWICGSGLTPASSYFTFNHVNDLQFDIFIVNNRALELDQFAISSNVDLQGPPFARSHMLFAVLEIGDDPEEPDHVAQERQRAHACTRPGGHPVCTVRYADVFQYLFGLL